MGFDFGFEKFVGYVIRASVDVVVFEGKGFYYGGW
jgi:hypothetical protein